MKLVNSVISGFRRLSNREVVLKPNSLNTISPGIVLGSVWPLTPLVNHVVYEESLVECCQFLKHASDEIGPDGILPPAQDGYHSREDSRHEVGEVGVVAVEEIEQGVCQQITHISLVQGFLDSG